MSRTDVYFVKKKKIKKIKQPVVHFEEFVMKLRSTGLRRLRSVDALSRASGADRRPKEEAKVSPADHETLGWLICNS